mmetsp:Transcript_17618/g.29749  ORF Transcript_17618/g.29749 Transcript_17618/m.29749 type:complete len:85 (-) Transcript_17618:362-616(-)
MRIQTDRYNDKVVEQVLKVYEEERGSIMQDESRDQAQKKRDWLERSGCFVFIEQQPRVERITVRLVELRRGKTREVSVDKMVMG